MKEKKHQLELVKINDEVAVISAKGGFPLSVRELKRLLKKWLKNKELG
jgi:hypothetical protein